RVVTRIPGVESLHRIVAEVVTKSRVDSPFVYKEFRGRIHAGRDVIKIWDERNTLCSRHISVRLVHAICSYRKCSALRMMRLPFCINGMGVEFQIYRRYSGKITDPQIILLTVVVLKRVLYPPLTRPTADVPVNLQKVVAHKLARLLNPVRKVGRVQRLIAFHCIHKIIEAADSGTTKDAVLRLKATIK